MNTNNTQQKFQVRKKIIQNNEYSKKYQGTSHSDQTQERTGHNINHPNYAKHPNRTRFPTNTQQNTIRGSSSMIPPHYKGSQTNRIISPHVHNSQKIGKTNVPMTRGFNSFNSH